jgi:diguanylate cyclase (GGDEF)-like protein
MAAMLNRLLNRLLLRPTIRDNRDLGRFVLMITSICVVVPVSMEVVDQFLFFVTWSIAWRDWVMTFFEAAGLAAPLSYGYGRSHMELFKAQQAAERASLTDPMTGLMNRRALTERLTTLDVAALALVIVDIDHFKRVNDLYGHLSGDRVIETVARIMSDELAELGPLARVGGEEFALVTPISGYGRLLKKLEVARQTIAETPVIVYGTAVRVTISAGVACGERNHGFDKLYAEADRALYLAKLSGRNRVLRFEDIVELDAGMASAGRFAPRGADQRASA